MGLPPHSIALDTVVRRRPGQISADLDDEVALMSVEKGNYYLLNHVGARIWKGLERPRRIGDLCDTLVTEYEVTRQQIEVDVIELIGELLRCDLVECVDESVG